MVYKILNFQLKVEEEQTLLNELRKIELRKKEREKKTQDLQKLITAADSSQSETKRLEKKGPKKKVIQQKNIKAESTVRKYFDFNNYYEIMYPKLYILGYKI